MLTTKVNPKHRNPWVPTAEYPVTEEEFKIMRYEIKRMRQDLYKKQMRMENNEKYHGSTNKRLQAFLKSPEAFTRGKTNAEVQDLWYKLYSLEQSRSYSISGLKEREKMTIESLNRNGYDFIDEANFKQFCNFMDWVRSEYDLDNISSDEVVEFYQEHQNMTMDELKGAFDEWYNERTDRLETTGGEDFTAQAKVLASDV